jgi:hypothetical protein
MSESEHWKNIVGQRNKENIALADEIYDKIKDNSESLSILSSLMSRIYTEKEKPLKPVKNYRGHPELKKALVDANLLEFYGDSCSHNAIFFDHSEIGTLDNVMHSIGRPYGLSIDQDVINKFQSLVDAGVSVFIDADMVHFPGRTIEIDIYLKPKD